MQHLGDGGKPSRQQRETKNNFCIERVRITAYIHNVETYEEAVPSPDMKKHAVSTLNDVFDDAIMSSRDFAISAAKTPKPVKKRKEAIREHAQGPNSSMALPRRAAKGYWPIMPLCDS
jgi:hypothetical protein